jgi:predicted nucleic acid-binding protein
MLLDSNIIIYAVKPEHMALRTFIAQRQPAVSAVSYVEVLGYHLLTAPDKADFELLFQQFPVLPISDLIIQQATRIRQTRKMSLGDALIAATALTYQLTLATHNLKDFQWIHGLQLHDPLAGV